MSSTIDLDFYEQVIMFHCLTDESFLGTVIEHLDPEYFTDNNISNIIDIVTTFYNTRNQIPSLTEIKAHLSTPELVNNFKTVVQYIQNFRDSDSMQRPEFKFSKDELYENTEQFFKQKAVYNTMIDVAENSTGKDIDTGEILGKFESACNITLDVDKGLDYLNEIDRHIQDLKEEDSTISTGWDWLDEKLSGGLLEHGRAIYVFAGETNIGKSIFLGNMAVNLANQGKTVLLVTLEMSELVYAKRLSTQITQIPIKELSNQTDFLKESLEEYKKDHDRSRILIKEFPPSTITSSNLQAFIKKLSDSGIEIDAIVLDYVNLLTTRDGVNSYERVKYVTEKLRALSYIFACPIITATQLNRSGYNEINPGLETVGESYGLAATADAMFSIWQEEEDAELGIIKLGLMKNRFGQNFGSVTLSIDYTTLTLSEDAELADSLPEIETSEIADTGETLADTLDFLYKNDS